MSNLPANWSETRIGELCELVNGRAFKPSDWELSGLPIVRIQNLNRPDAKFNFFYGPVAERFLVRNGDLLFAWSGTPGTSFGAHIWSGQNAILNQHIFNVRYDDKLVDKQFFRYAINQTVDEQIAKAHGGVGLAHVTKGRFEETKIALPPLPEQRRIVVKLDSLSGKSQRARDQLDHVPRLVEKYKQAILAVAFKGSLTGLSPLSFDDTRIGDILTHGPQNGLYLTKDKYGRGTPILRIQNYGLNDAEDISSWRQVQISPAVQSQYAMATNDLIVNRVNSPSHLGKSLVVSDSMAGAVFESNMMKMRLHPSVAPRYVQLFLSSEIGRRKLTAGAKWAVNQASINQADVTNTTVPLVRLDEQESIVRRIDIAFNWISSLAIEASSAQKLIDHLDQAVLAKAFWGELVPQDPSDEPASVLLERIRAEREGRPTLRRRDGDERAPQTVINPKRLGQRKHGPSKITA